MKYAIVCEGPMPGNTPLLGTAPGKDWTLGQVSGDFWTYDDFNYDLQQFCPGNGNKLGNMGALCRNRGLTAVLKDTMEDLRAVTSGYFVPMMWPQYVLDFDLRLAKEVYLYRPEYVDHCEKYCRCSRDRIDDLRRYFNKDRDGTPMAKPLSREEYWNREMEQAVSRYSLALATMTLRDGASLIPTSLPTQVPPFSPDILRMSRPRLSASGSGRADVCSNTCDGNFRCSSTSGSSGTAGSRNAQSATSRGAQCVCATRRVARGVYAVRGCMLRGTVRGANQLGKRDEMLVDTMACPCNVTYVSVSCCMSQAGWVWEPAGARLGALLL